jgi:hypothetical protein
MRSKMPLLANDFVTVYESPNPDGAYCYTPGLVRLKSGRLLATMDLGGPQVADMNPPIALKNSERGFTSVGKIFTSDDGGQTWTHRKDFAGIHARPFVANGSVYVLGQAKDLFILRSDDAGETWSEQVQLTHGEVWHQSACNVHYARGNVYLVMEKRIHFHQDRWPVHEMAPVLMRGAVDADLTDRNNWEFASELAFHDVLPNGLDLMGFPFWTPYETRVMAPMGWLETNVVQFFDPDHVWHDPTEHTYHLWMRAHTGGTGYAAIAKVIEHADGTMTTHIAEVPSGQRILFVPCPGGQMRFHVLYDPEDKLYWLLSTLAWDSMTHIDKLPPDRYNLPNNERQVLALHFSKNMIDWRMAGIVAQGNNAKQSRHYASMVFDGDDLLVLSRSGDHKAKSAHDGNLITFHRVTDFRNLVY